MKYAWVHEHRDSFPVTVQREVLEVSASGYYDWLDRPPSPRAKRHEQIQAAVRQVHAESYGIYGSLKIANKLRERPDLESACRNTVAQVMRELGLKSRIAKTFTPTTTQSDPNKQPAPNQLAQDFTATAPNRKWVTDITYLATAEGWVYLAVVIGDEAEAIAKSRRLLELGVMVIGFGFPVVPKGQARLRVQVSAALEKDHLERALAAFGKL